MGKQWWTRRRYLGVVGTAALAGCSGAGPSNPFSGGIDEATREQYTGVATRIATELQEWRRARSETTRRLAGADVIRTGQPDEQQQWVAAEIGRLPEDVFRVDLVETSDWYVVASSRSARRGEPLTTREAPWQGDSFRYDDGEVFVARAEEALARSLVSFVIRVATEGDTQRLLVVQCDMDVLAGTFQQPSEAAYTQIVDGDGRIVASTRARDRLERNDGSLSEYPDAADSRAVQLALAGESGFVSEPGINDRGEDEGDDTEYVVAYAGVENNEWAVLTHVPRETARESG